MIRLFKCYQCWYIFDEEILYSGKHLRCECGAPEFRQVNPTFLNIFFYIVFQKKHALKRLLKRG